MKEPLAASLFIAFLFSHGGTAMSYPATHDFLQPLYQIGLRGRLALLLLLAVVVIGVTPPGVAAAAEEQTKAEEEEKKIPEPELISLPTKDRLDLKATYYGGTEGKDTVPIVILHDYKGNRNEFHALAMMLQSLGHAVLVPDLRGHGDSTRFLPVGTERPAEITAARMRRAADFAGIRHDLEALRSFLIDKNNAGELNLNKLGVIGSGMGATMALNWTLLDWSAPPLATGKQGQDVKALVLLSPEWSFKGISVDQALSHPGVRSEVSMLIFVGAAVNSKLEEAQRIHRVLEPYHPEPPPERVRQDKDLFLQVLQTNLQGTKLITVRGLDVPATIAQFIQLRLVNQPYPWSERQTLFD